MRSALTVAMLLAGGLLTSPLVGCGHRPAEIAMPEEATAAGHVAEQACLVEEVTFLAGGNLLAGALYLPRSTGPHPAIAMVLGSGPRDRNYGGAGPALGRHFAQHGYACLAWDKPGVGQSTGDYNLQTFRDRAEEALAAIAYFRRHADIRPDQIGLWGHSQGGMVVPLAASLSDHVAFVIAVAGWQGPA